MRRAIAGNLTLAVLSAIGSSSPSYPLGTGRQNATTSPVPAPSAIGDQFNLSAASCAQCTIAGDTVRLYYWPQTHTGNSISGSIRTFANATTLPRSAIVDGVTMTSPSVYISMDTVWINDDCIAGHNPGTVLTLRPQDISTFWWAQPGVKSGRGDQGSRIDYASLGGVIYEQNQDCAVYGCPMMYNTSSFSAGVPTRFCTLGPGGGIDTPPQHNPKALQPVIDVAPISLPRLTTISTSLRTTPAAPSPTATQSVAFATSTSALILIPSTASIDMNSLTPEVDLVASATSKSALISSSSTTSAVTRSSTHNVGELIATALGLSGGPVRSSSTRRTTDRDNSDGLLTSSGIEGVISSGGASGASAAFGTFPDPGNQNLAASSSSASALLSGQSWTKTSRDSSITTTNADGSTRDHLSARSSEQTQTLTDTLVPGTATPTDAQSPSTATPGYSSSGVQRCSGCGIRVLVIALGLMAVF